MLVEFGVLLPEEEANFSLSRTELAAADNCRNTSVGRGGVLERLLMAQ